MYILEFILLLSVVTHATVSQLHHVSQVTTMSVLLCLTSPQDVLSAALEFFSCDLATQFFSFVSVAACGKPLQLFSPYYGRFDVAVVVEL